MSSSTKGQSTAKNRRASDIQHDRKRIQTIQPILQYSIRSKNQQMEPFACIYNYLPTSIRSMVQTKYPVAVEGRKQTPLFLNYYWSIKNSSLPVRSFVRVVKEVDLKSTGPWPRRFKSCSDRIFAWKIPQPWQIKCIQRGNVISRESHIYLVFYLKGNWKWTPICEM